MSEIRTKKEKKRIEYQEDVNMRGEKETNARSLMRNKICVTLKWMIKKYKEKKFYLIDFKFKGEKISHEFCKEIYEVSTKLLTV